MPVWDKRSLESLIKYEIERAWVLGAMVGTIVAWIFFSYLLVKLPHLLLHKAVQ